MRRLMPRAFVAGCWTPRAYMAHGLQFLRDRQTETRRLRGCKEVYLRRPLVDVRGARSAPSQRSTVDAGDIASAKWSSREPPRPRTISHCFPSATFGI